MLPVDLSRYSEGEGDSWERWFYRTWLSSGNSQWKHLAKGRDERERCNAGEERQTRNVYKERCSMANWTTQERLDGARDIACRHWWRFFYRRKSYRKRFDRRENIFFRDSADIVESSCSIAIGSTWMIGYWIVHANAREWNRTTHLVESILTRLLVDHCCWKSM